MTRARKTRAKPPTNQRLTVGFKGRKWRNLLQSASLFGYSNVGFVSEEIAVGQTIGFADQAEEPGFERRPRPRPGCFETSFVNCSFCLVSTCYRTISKGSSVFFFDFWILTISPLVLQPRSPDKHFPDLVRRSGLGL